MEKKGEPSSNESLPLTSAHPTDSAGSSHQEMSGKNGFMSLLSFPSSFVSPWVPALALQGNEMAEIATLNFLGEVTKAP